MYKQLFIAFLRSNLLGYGGGLSAIPLMKKEVVDHYKWFDEESFSNLLALANTLPGPINTKMAGYIGFHLKGFWGMVVALLATIMPTAILLIILLTTLESYKDIAWVQGMLKGVLPIAAVMIGVLAWSFISMSRRLLGTRYTVTLLLASGLIIIVLGIHPAFMIISLIIYALTAKVKTQIEVDNK